ncbi:MULTISPECIES: flavin reductase [unclassified Acinetobacter]|uniref:flavin reductase n=1 Tax=unclassified Acinetobacter TaxID=196816 RepID=UPI0035BA3419
MVDALNFRNAMSLLTSAVNIVTTAGESGTHGFTASAVCSVTDTPPTLLVCMNGNARSYEHFVANGVLAVNVLAEQHQNLSNVFASPLPSEERFAQAAWKTSLTGSPILSDALVSFDCRIGEITQVGSHSIFICPIVAIEYNTADEFNPKGLAYFKRAYHSVGLV